MKKKERYDEKRKNITILDIAKAAGVSIATVSRTINNSGYVGYETKKKILKIIEKTGFKPNTAARSMIKKKSSIIGIVVPEINNPFLAGLIVTIEEMLYKENLSLMICNSQYKYQKVNNFIDDLIQRNAEGIIFVATELTDRNIIKKIKKNLEVVSIGTKFENFDCVRLTEWQAAYDITEYLIGLGHKHIACIGYNPASSVTMERMRGYTDALSRNGLQLRDEYMLDSNDVNNTGYVRASQLMKLKEPPSAIFAINDFYALNAYFAVIEKGLMIGKDISIVGFDDIDIARLVDPPLTTVGYSTPVMAEVAVQLLLKRLKGNSTEEPREILLPANIVKRKSAQKYKNEIL